MSVDSIDTAAISAKLYTLARVGGMLGCRQPGLRGPQVLSSCYTYKNQSLGVQISSHKLSPPLLKSCLRPCLYRFNCHCEVSPQVNCYTHILVHSNRWHLILTGRTGQSTCRSQDEEVVVVVEEEGDRVIHLQEPGWVGGCCGRGGRGQGNPPSGARMSRWLLW